MNQLFISITVFVGIVIIVICIFVMFVLKAYYMEPIVNPEEDGLTANDLNKLGAVIFDGINAKGDVSDYTASGCPGSSGGSGLARIGSTNSSRAGRSRRASSIAGLAGSSAAPSAKETTIKQALSNRLHPPSQNRDFHELRFLLRRSKKRLGSF